MKQIKQTLITLTLILISIDSHGRGSHGHSSFVDIFPLLILLIIVITLLSYIGYRLSDKKGKFFSENNVSGGLLILLLISIVVGSLYEIFNGKFGISTILLLIYGLVFYFGNRMNKK